MGEIAIRVDNLGKRYRIGERVKYKALRDTLTDAIHAPFRVATSWLNGHRASVADPRSDNIIWAVKDVSFDVKQGEVVGIIGRNGAGKSTLLKILSRITKPTEGHARINGRVGSLLEVGTGFHPELTGRENVYLNGAILGMRKKEIDRKFDEMVAFAEVEKFIDTPVKYYSSGMYVRLAFAVAAHLETETLLVDEVLAVGDATFQKKCLGKMGDVARQGRTVLFVSHNAVAIQAFCKQALWLKDGRLFQLGCTDDVVKQYQHTLTQTAVSQSINERKDREGDGSAIVTSVFVTDADGHNMITPLSRIKITIEYESKTRLVNPVFLIGLYDHNNLGIFYFDSGISTSIPEQLPSKGKVTCTTETIRLTPKSYSVNIAILKGGVNGIWTDYIQNAVYFEVIPTDINGSGKLPPSHILFTADSSWQVEDK